MTASNIITSANSPFPISSGVTSNFDLISSGGTEVVLSGGTVRKTDVEGGGVLVIEDGGSGDSATLIGISGSGFGNFATEIVSQGGSVTNTAVSSGGILVVSSGGLAASTTVASTGFGVSAGGLVLSGANGGGTASATLVTDNGQEAVFSGGTEITGTVTSGGTLFVFSGGTDSGTTIGSGATMVLFGGAVTSGEHFRSGGTLAVAGGFAVSHFSVSKGFTLVVASGGTLSGGTISAGGLGVLQSGGSISGTVVVKSGGTFEFDGINPLSGVHPNLGATLELANGAMVSGAGQPLSGITGVLLSGGSALAIPVFAGGVAKIRSGGLASGATFGNAGAGVVFAGGTDLDATILKGGNVTVSAGGFDSGAKVSSGGKLTLTVSSGGTEVAEIHLIGNYSSGNFHITSGISGSVKITDPAVVNGGSVVSAPAQPFPRGGIDLPNIAFGAHTALAYSQNNADTGGTLMVSDGRHAAAIALLGNYMAGSFAVAADGHGGTLVTQAQTGTAPLLTHPRA